jgi:lysophospholipase L1-like esterase
MKRINPYLFFLLLLGIMACQNASISNKKIALEQKKILFLGNSITHNGLYVSLIEYALKKNNPQQHFEIISIGLASETLSCLTEKDHPFPRPCLKERLNRALTAVQPDLIVACYGMNDGIYHPLEKGRKAAFQNGIDDLIQASKKANATLLLISPPPFDALPIQDKVVDRAAADFSYRSPYQDYDAVLKDYSEYLSQLSPKIPVINWHGAINEVLKQKRKTEPHFSFTQDGIHPNPEGHLLMAQLFLKGIGYEKNTLVLNDWTLLKNDALFQQIHQKRQQRSERWLNYIGYTRGKTVKSLSSKSLLLLMGGQSNMVGLGKKTDLKNKNLPQNIQFINEGLNARLKKNQQLFGPEYGLAAQLNEKFPHQHFTLIKYAIGGASLLDWAPNYSSEKAKITGHPEFGNLFAQFFQQIDSLQQVSAVEPAALLWMQGERDARIPEAGKDYYEHFKQFIHAFRKKIGNPQLPILIGKVNPPENRYPALEMVRAAQLRLSKELENVFLIETDDLSKLNDNLHYDTQGQLELGKRYGNVLIDILE